MMTMLDDLPEVLRRLDKLRSLKDQAQGGFDQVMKEIREKFGCQNLKEAEGRLEAEMDEVLATLRIYNKKYRKAQQRWPHLFPNSPEKPKKP